VSGVLALMQDFFVNQKNPTRHEPQPGAGFKAMVIMVSHGTGNTVRDDDHDDHRLEQRRAGVIVAKFGFFWFTKKSCINASTPDTAGVAMLVPLLIT